MSKYYVTMVFIYGYLLAKHQCVLIIFACHYFYVKYLATYKSDNKELVNLLIIITFNW